MNVGGNTFYRKRTSIHFKVRNTTNELPPAQQKKFYVFNMVIYPGEIKDLLMVSGISEADIRESLIKGELANRIRNGDLAIVSSSIDLLQFDAEQRDFLIAAGINLAVDPNKIAKDSGTPYLELGPLGDSVPANSLFFDIDGTPSYTDENGDPHPLSSGGGGGGAPSTAEYIVLSLAESGLPNQRSLDAGANISITDGGSYITISSTYTPNNATVSAPGVIQLSGDIGGTATSPSVLKLNGVTISGSADTGKVLTASSSSAASWETPAAGGGGAPTTATYLTLSPNGDLTNERFLVAGENIDFIDEGPGGALIIDSPYIDATASVKGVLQLAGDLGGTATSPSVVKVNGVTISGVPATGYIPVATSTTAASWQPAAVAADAAPLGAQYLTLASDGYLTNERVLTQGTNISFTDGGAGGPLTINSTYSYTPTDATTGAKGILQLAGDLGGTATLPAVLKVNGITVTGTPAVGQSLIASSTSAASWAALNLATAAAVTGVLPRGNQQAQNMGGDVTGTTAASVVSKVNGITVTGTPASGQVLTASSPTAASWQDASGGGGGGAPTDAQYLTLVSNGTLTNERVLTAGPGIILDDAGAGSTLTITSVMPDATSNSKGGIQLTGNLGGFPESPIVVKINGADVPIAGTLITGNTLQVVSATTLGYSPLNLAGGVNYVSGLLPGDNMANATASLKGAIILAGDLAGSAATPSVAKINGATVPVAGSLVTGNILQVTGASTVGYAALNLAGGANFITGVLPAANMTASSTSVTGAIRLATDLAGTSTAPTVVAMTGATGVATIKCATVTNTSQTNVVQRNVVTAIVVTSNATPTTQATIATTSNTLTQIDVLILGNKSDDTQGASYKRSVLVRNVAGTLSIVGAVTDNGTMEDDSTWDATLLVSGANIIVQVTGKAATTINWTSIYSVFQVT